MVPVPGVKPSNASKSYTFFGPVVVSGTVAPGAGTITGIDKATFNTLLKLRNPDGSWSLLVSGPGAKPETMVTNVSATVFGAKVVYTIKLSKPLGAPLTTSTSLAYTIT
jgi:hypothetical protein